MSLRGILFIVFAGISVFTVVLLTRNYLASLEARPAKVVQAAPKAPETKILIAKQDLPTGRVLTLEDVVTQAWPKEALNPNYIIATDEKPDLIGKVVRSPMTAGEPVTKSAIVAQGERGFMAAILTPGMRASTVNLTPVAGVGGFIFPGDRVDVILTQSIEQLDGNGTVVSETVMQNVRVLGVDQATEQSENGPKIRRTATLEVTPKMAEKVAMLERLGTLSLSLRSLARENATEEAMPISIALTGTEAHEVSSYLTRPEDREEAKKPTIILRRGSTAVALESRSAPDTKTASATAGGASR